MSFPENVQGIVHVMPDKPKDSRQAGMTPKINIQFSDALRSLPQGSLLIHSLLLDKATRHYSVLYEDITEKISRTLSGNDGRIKCFQLFYE